MTILKIVDSQNQHYTSCQKAIKKIVFFRDLFSEFFNLEYSQISYTLILRTFFLRKQLNEISRLWILGRIKATGSSLACPQYHHLHRDQAHSRLTSAITAPQTPRWGSWPLLVIIFWGMETPLALFPNGNEFQLDTVERDELRRALTLFVTSTARTALCPECEQPSQRSHSRYWRTVADLPWADYTVQVRVALRKWRCGTTDCRRRIFCERLPMITRPRWRRTVRLATRQHQLAVALGGAPGARLSVKLGCPASRNTLLRILRRTPGPAPPTPRVLGVDDWAQRKGQRYGTVLIDVERRLPIALLADREAATLSQWLQTHPGIEVICRDRAGAYAEGARSGAPDAVQVADRFHLLRNVADAVQLVFEQHRKALKTVTTEPFASVVSVEPPSVGEVAGEHEGTPLPICVPLVAEVTPPPSQPRTERYEQVCQLAQQGWPFTAIAKAAGLHRKTVSLYVRGAFSPRRHSRSILDPYKPYLLARWNAGHWTGTQLWQEIQQQGYRGKRTTVLRYIGRLRQAAGVAPRTRTPQLATPVKIRVWER